MTIVAIWYEKNDNLLWAAADTRVSAPGQTGSGGVVIRTDSGSKLLGLPVKCHRISDDPGVVRGPHFSTTYGFAFAGDVVPALMTYATAATLLQTLITTGSASPPKLIEVATLLQKLVERFSCESLGSSNGQYGSFEAALFGWCAHERSYRVFRIGPCLGRSKTLLAVDEPQSTGAVTILGERALFVDELSKLTREGDRFGRTGRLPKLALESIVRRSAGTVGGNLSLGTLSQFGFNIYSFVEPVEPGKPEARFSFNGIDIWQELGAIGHYFIGINGMV